MRFIPYPHSCTSLYTLVDSHQEVATREGRRMDAHAGRRPPQGATRPDLHGEGTICIRAQTGPGCEEEAARGGVNRGSSTEACDTDSMPPPPVNTQASIAVCVCEQLYVPVPTLHSFHIIGSYIDSTPAQLVNAQVINDAANAAALSIMEAPPEIGNRSPGIWSVCFQGGTFDRVKQR